MRGFAATVRAAMAESFANQRSFWLQVNTMVLNDLAWVAFWLVFYHRVGSVRGWDAQRTLLLLSVFATSAGIVLGLLANCRRVGQMAADGELDAVLALPVPPLSHLLVRRISAVHLGDALFGPALFVASGSPTPARIGIYLVGVAGSATLLVGFLLATQSLAFYSGRGETGEMGFNAILMLANYPADIFAGFQKLVVFTAVPAAFVSTVPASLVDTFEPVRAVELLAAAGAFAFLGWAMFTLGLRRYSSGSVWTHA
jgi:viologen exporter family transport system permease protein